MYSLHLNIHTNGMSVDGRGVLPADHLGDGLAHQVALIREDVHPAHIEHVVRVRRDVLVSEQQDH